MSIKHVVTTCSKEGWDLYGERMVRSYVKNWPCSIPLHVYAEGFELPAFLRAHQEQLPRWQVDFKDRHKDNPDAHGIGHKKPFKRQAVRFSHKVGAICDLADRMDKGWLIWIDADTETKGPITDEWIESLMPENAFFALLQRKDNHSECGFFIVNMAHECARPFFQTLKTLYTSDELFRLPETHDSYLIDRVLNLQIGGGWLNQDHVVNLARPGDNGHVWERSVLARKLRHFKGDRKTMKGYNK